MGASSSKPLERSSLDDCMLNLTSTLEDLMKWEDKASQVRMAVEGHSEEGEEKTPGQRELNNARSVLACIEEMIGQKLGVGGDEKHQSTLQQGAQFTKQWTSGSGGKGEGEDRTRRAKTNIESIKNKVEREKKLGQLVSPLSFPASQLFRGVATGAISKYVEPKTAEAKSQSSLLPQGAAENEDTDRARREEIGAKYWYIHRMLKTVLGSAEYAYKFKSRLDHYKKLMKPKRFDLMTEMEKLRIRQSNEKTLQSLNDTLLNWDKAKLALKWLIRDYHLIVGSHLTHHAVHDLIRKRQEIQSSPNLLQDSMIQRRVQQIDDFCGDLELAAYELDVQRYQHERDHLNVGLFYHDSELKGAISANECSDLSASLFARLDYNRDGLISADDLQKSLLSMVEDIDSRQSKCERLKTELLDLAAKHSTMIAGEKAELLEVQHAQTETQIRALEKEIEDLRRLLRSVWNYFHHSFAAHVFGVSPESVRELRFPLNLLLMVVNEVDQAGNQDPLLVQELRGLERVGHDQATKSKYALRPETTTATGQGQYQTQQTAQYQPPSQAQYQPQYQPSVAESMPMKMRIQSEERQTPPQSQYYAPEGKHETAGQSSELGIGKDIQASSYQPKHETETERSGFKGIQSSSPVELQATSTGGASSYESETEKGASTGFTGQLYESFKHGTKETMGSAVERMKHAVGYGSPHESAVSEVERQSGYGGSRF